MREGGINASEGANALKSGLASMINPTAKASEFLQKFGINVKGIVEANKGDIRGTVIGFAKALDTLDPLNRARAIEQMFGKFQFSRLSTLFQNVIADGSQATNVLSIANATAEELAILSEREMKKVSDSPMFKFQKSIEDIQAKLAPVGEAFLKAVTPIMEFVGRILDGFNNLSEGSKQFITILVTAVAGIGPILLMTFGLIANGVANIMKLFTNMKAFINRTTKPSDILGEQTSYMNTEQLKSAAIAASLDQSHAKLRQTFTSEAAAVDALTQAYRRAVEAQQAYSGIPGVPVGNPNAVPPKKYAGGVRMVPGPKGAGDIVPALLSPGEAVIPAKSAQKYAPVIRGMIAGNLPGFEDGTPGAGMRQSVIGPLTEKQTEGLARTGKTLKEISDEVYAGPYNKMPVTDFGTQITPTTGHSFPAFGVGGIYQKPDGSKVFVKPQIDATSALAEIRGTTIARDVHGLIAPQQKLAVMMDPTDPENRRKFLVLESALDERLADVPKTFSKDNYIKQLVASLLRGDKDLGVGNLGENILADVGPAGVFQRASGKRQLGGKINSMEEQAIINLLGVKGGAKRFFAESTSEIASSMTAAEFDTLIKIEIDNVLPKLISTIAGFGSMPTDEAAAYQAMIERLKQGRNVDWSKYHSIATKVIPRQYNEGTENVEPFIHDPITANIKGSKATFIHDGKQWQMVLQESHAQEELKYEDVKDQLSFLGSQSAMFKNFKILGNLTMSLPDKANQQLRVGGKKGPAGMETGAFKAVYNAIRGKMMATLKKTLQNKSPDSQYVSASQQIEDQIGTFAIANAKDNRVDDPALAAGAKQALINYSKTQGPIGDLALKYLERAGLAGTLRQVVPEEFDASGKALKDNAILKAQFDRGELEFHSNGMVFSPKGASPKLRSARFNLEGSSKNGGDAVRKAQIAMRDAWIASGAKSPLPSGLKLRGNSLEEGIMSNKETGFLGYDDTKTGFGPEISIVDMPSLIKYGMVQQLAEGTSNVKPTGKPKASVFDIDDTLVHASALIESNRAKNEKLPKEQRTKWYEELAKNPQGVTAAIERLRAAQARGNKILLMTARPEAYRASTLEMLQKLGIDMNGIQLITRRDKDYRKPEQMKLDKTSKYMQWYDIEEFYDDLPQTRDAISTLGIKVFDPLALAKGGMIPGYANGVFSVPGPKGAGDVVPAMLSPGEAVIPAKQASKHRPLITQMIAGNLPGYASGGIIPGSTSGVYSMPGYEDGGFVRLEFNEARPLPVVIMADRTTAQGAVKPQDQLDALEDNTKQQKQTNDENKKTRTGLGDLKKTLLERTPRLGRVQGALYGASAALGTASMIPGPIGQAAQATLAPIGAMTAAMSVVPGKLGLVVGALAAVATVAGMIRDHFDKIRQAAYNLAEAMGMSNKAIAKFAEFAKKVSASEIMDKRRAVSLFNIVPGKKTFGESFMETDAAKEFVKNIDKSITQGGLQQAEIAISQQLSAAIVANVLTPAQARSIANNLGIAIKNQSFGMTVSANITELFGPNGEILDKEPLETRIKFVEEGQKSLENLLDPEFINKGIKETGWLSGIMAVSWEKVDKFGGQLAANLVSVADAQQQAVDSLALIYEKRIADKVAAGDTAAAIKLQNQYLTEQKTLLNKNQENNLITFEKLNELDDGVLQATRSAAEKSVGTAYEGTGFEGSAAAATSTVAGMRDYNKSTQVLETLLNTFMATKDIGLAQGQYAAEKFGATTEGQDMLTRLLQQSPTEANRALETAMALPETKQMDFLLNISTMDAGKAKETLDMIDTVEKTTGVFEGTGNEHMVSVMLKFATDPGNQAVLNEMQTNLNELALEKTINITTVEKHLGTNVANSILAGGFDINKYKTKQEKMTFLTEFTTLYTMKGDPAMQGAVRAWLEQPENKGKTEADYFAYQADRTVQERTADFTLPPGAEETGSGTSPQSSWLDQYVKNVRDAGTATQKLTTGFNDSAKALKNFASKDKDLIGLFSQLKKAGVSANIIESALGGDEETTNKLINRKTGQLKEGASKILKGINDALLSQQKIDWLKLTDVEKRGKYNEMYNANLDVLKISEDKINKTYDDRVKALDEIRRLNDRNLAQQQSVLSIGEALSRGDIGAAAQAALEMRKQNTQYAIEEQKNNLEKARQEELKNLTVDINGVQMRRADIEEKIRVNQEKITKSKAEELEKSIRIGQLADAEYAKIQKRGGKLVKVDTKAMGGLVTGYAYGGTVVPKGYAVGGGIYGTDTVPAMLTPGEFVIRKSAVDKIGTSRLNRMNSGASVGDSVYNYTIQVNVKSDVNANQIADTVLRQIEKLDAQRLRSVRL